jgi:hypothetical protein
MMMATNHHSTGKNPRASQGGLTSPKLYDSGLDFRIAVAKNGRGRHVRISCINVTNTLSSVVIISHPNQLHICRTSLFAQSQVLYLCFTESLLKYHVANMSRQVLQKGLCESVANTSLLQKYHVNRQKYHSCTNTTDPHQWKMTPPVENESDPLQWKMTPPRELETTSGK